MNIDFEKKFVVVLGDGMADRRTPDRPRTPLETASKPNIDGIAKFSDYGLIRTVPEGTTPGSDVCNMAVLGIDSSVYTGRSPLEALSMGVNLDDSDVAVRVNLVNLSSPDLSVAAMKDYSAGEITTEEGRALVESIEEKLGSDKYRFVGGTAYRHCLIIKDGKVGAKFTPPHDITSRGVKDYLPSGENSEIFREFIEKSHEILKNHPVNLRREARGLLPATHVWFWGLGTKPMIPEFRAYTGLKGAMISAVDLLKGIAIGAKMTSFDVKGATGTIDTDIEAKVSAALRALEDGYDFVYIHIEAPDEAGHHGDFDEKVRAIELVDKAVGGVLDGVGDKYALTLAVLPDHATPVSVKTHTSESVPYIVYRSFDKKKGVDRYDEESVKDGRHIEKGTDFIGFMIK